MILCYDNRSGQHITIDVKIRYALNKPLLKLLAQSGSLIQAKPKDVSIFSTLLGNRKDRERLKL